MLMGFSPLTCRSPLFGWPYLVQHFFIHLLSICFPSCSKQCFTLNLCVHFLPPWKLPEQDNLWEPKFWSHRQERVREVSSLHSSGAEPRSCSTRGSRMPSVLWIRKWHNFASDIWKLHFILNLIFILLIWNEIVYTFICH